ncbi:DUF402 domain-containing protein [Paenibacillus cymbidii]|uniref:DUF402 domain-containing protein n=1 Tax=Paenibacillus cymbidii TaxID=1639034 RepID=UPI0010821260|nr:DUF402 domain-containing protein [Paenibacillus cymbidii]
MNPNRATIIKSFKHDGHLHRMWLENWLVPGELLHASHAAESMLVLVNSQTRIKEADGREWISKIPGVSFFIPQAWYNIVALIESGGIRYYCNVASPAYRNGNVITYIDYDLDVIVTPSKDVHVVDQDEYERHKSNYHYSPVVEEKVKNGLDSLMARIRRGDAPFDDRHVNDYYALWQKQTRQRPGDA